MRPRQFVIAAAAGAVLAGLPGCGLLDSNLPKCKNVGGSPIGITALRQEFRNGGLTNAPLAKRDALCADPAVAVVRNVSEDISGSDQAAVIAREGDIYCLVYDRPAYGATVTKIPEKKGKTIINVENVECTIYTDRDERRPTDRLTAVIRAVAAKGGP
jgi:hypothetical protein